MRKLHFHFFLFCHTFSSFHDIFLFGSNSLHSDCRKYSLMKGCVWTKQKTRMTVWEYFADLPNLAAFKHACVHDIGAHESRLNSLNLLGQQLVGQRLVEAHCSKLTGTVILSQTKIQTRWLCLYKSTRTTVSAICIWICYFVFLT